MERITARSNPLLTHIRRLAADRGYRHECGEYLADSPKLLQEALLWDAELVNVVCGDGMELPPLPAGVRAVQVPADVMASVSPMRAPQGVLFTCRIPTLPLPEKLTGRRQSARAVGGAVGHNPISIILPCHRVVGTNGSLTGYAGGVEIKRALLSLEGVELTEGLFAR